MRREARLRKDITMKNTRILCGAIGLALLGGSAAGQQRVSTYNVWHPVNFYAPRADTARVAVADFRHVWLIGQGQQDEAHISGNQAPGFDPYGVEAPGANHGTINSGLPGFGPTPVVYDTHVITNAGIPGTPACLFLSLPQGSMAMACNEIRIDPWVNQAPLSINGRIASNGYADARVTGRGAAWAYAYSGAGITIDSGETLQNGTINWTFGAHVDSVGDGAGDSIVQDPVRFIATNPINGDEFSWDIVAIDMTTAGGGVVDIDNGRLFVDVPEFTLDVVIDGAVIDPAQAGHLRIEVSGGAVQSASASGIYAGLAPPAGLAIPFDLPMPPITLDYDLGLDPALPWDIRAELGGGGGGQSTLDDCPADLAEPFGVLDLADVNAFVLGFVEMLPQGDLNGDGIWDLGDVGLFVESFLAGCP
jgi:hypothetical protein